MRLGLPFIAQIRAGGDALGSWTAETLDAVVSAIGPAYHVEHNADDTHGNIHATGISVSGQPRVVAFRTATQSLTTGVLTPINLTEEDLDVGAMHDTTTLNTRITVPAAGFYLIFSKLHYAVSGANDMRNRIHKNGNTTLPVSEVVNGTTLAGATTVTNAAALDLIIGDYLELIGFQNSGGNVNVGNATRQNASEIIVIKLW